MSSALVRLSADLADGSPEREQALDRGETRRCRGRLDDSRDAIDDPLGHRVDRVVLRPEVQVEGALRDACCRDDVVHRRASDTLVHEDAEGSIDECSLARLAALRCPGCGRTHGPLHMTDGQSSYQDYEPERARVRQRAARCAPTR